MTLISLRTVYDSDRHCCDRGWLVEMDCLGSIACRRLSQRRPKEAAVAMHARLEILDAVRDFSCARYLSIIVKSG